jgi:hypothetical protein
MMKKMLAVLSAGALALVLSGCATAYPVGGILTDVKLPGPVTSNTLGTPLKVGTSTCKSYLAMVATGDASIQAACANGGIKKIYYVDWTAHNILGIIGEYTCTVYGE